MSLKHLVLIGFLASLVACDAIVNKDKLVPPEEPQIPQAVVEAVRYTNPGMLDATLTRMAQGEVWLAEYPTSSYRNLMLLDNKGEILFENHLVGKLQQLPAAVREEANRLAQDGFIESAAVILKDKQTAIGYVVEIKLKNGVIRKLRFNTGNVLEADNSAGSLSRITAVYLTTTEQIGNEVLIPAFIRQFFAQNQFVGANVAVYIHEDKTVKIILTNYQLDKKSVITTEITIGADGQVLEWIAPLEKEITYQTTAQNETPAEVNNLIAAQSSTWTWEYTAVERQFGKIAQWKVRGKDASENTYWATLDLRNGISGVVKSVLMDAGELPANAKQYLGNTWPNWQWSKGQKLQQVGKSTVDKYVTEVKTNGDTYIVLFDGNGNRLYQYKK
jgi:hypothetical protein